MWAEGVALDMIAEDNWEIKFDNGLLDSRLRFYHSPHWRIKNVRPPKLAVPIKARWEGAEYIDSIIASNDILCKTSGQRLCGSRDAPAKGTIRFGRNQRICMFEDSSIASSDLTAAMLSIRAAIEIIERLALNSAPPTTKVWMVTDSKQALQKIWGPSCSSEDDKLVSDIKKLLQRVTESMKLDFFPVHSKDARLASSTKPRTQSIRTFTTTPGAGFGSIKGLYWWFESNDYNGSRNPDTTKLTVLGAKSVVYKEKKRQRN